MCSASVLLYFSAAALVVTQERQSIIICIKLNIRELGTELCTKTAVLILNNFNIPVMSFPVHSYYVTHVRVSKYM